MQGQGKDGSVIRLYEMPSSGNCHKARLALSMLGLEYEAVMVDYEAGEQNSDWFRAISPFGQVPALSDGEVAVTDSQAILVYLGARYAAGDLWPTDPAGAAEVVRWLSFAANELWNGPAKARVIKGFGYAGDLAAAQARSTAALEALDRHLAGRDWLAVGRPTIADLACYPYVALAPEGGIEPADYGSVAAWLGRVEALPGFVPMA
jgi:glutathione S-transferase